MTAPAKRLEFGEQYRLENRNDGWNCTIFDSSGDEIAWVEVIERDKLAEIIKKVNALAGLRVENGELRELLEAVKRVCMTSQIKVHDIEALYDAYQKVTAP